MATNSISSIPTDSSDQGGERESAWLKCPVEQCGGRFPSADLFLLHLCHHHRADSLVSTSTITAPHWTPAITMPHRCPSCLDTFHNPYLLRLHIMTAHSNTVEQTQSCSESSVKTKRTASSPQHHNTIDTETESGEQPVDDDECRMSDASDVNPVRTPQLHGLMFPLRPALINENSNQLVRDNPHPITHPLTHYKTDSIGQMKQAGHDCADCMDGTTSSANSSCIRSAPWQHEQELPVIKYDKCASSEANGTATVADDTTEMDSGEDNAFDAIKTMKARGEFPCRLCGRVFPNLRAMKGHNRVHMASAPYQCNVCCYASGDKATLVKHMKQHNGERPYECRLCRYAFTTKANCERHLKNRHQMRQREQLTDNLIYHGSGGMMDEGREEGKNEDTALATCLEPLVSAIVCPVCHIVVRHQDSLADHMRRCHPVADSKTSTIRCKICGADFSIRAVAYQHIKVCHSGADPGDALQYLPEYCRNQTLIDSAIQCEQNVGKRQLSPDNGSFKCTDDCTSPTPTMSETQSVERMSLSDSETARNTPEISGDIAANQELLDCSLPLDLSVKSRRTQNTTENASHRSQMGIPQDKKLSDVVGNIIMPPFTSFPFWLMSSFIHPFNRAAADTATHRVDGNILKFPIHRDARRTDQIMNVVPMLTPSSDDEHPLKDFDATTPDERIPVTLMADHTFDGSAVTKPKQRRYRTQRPFSCAHCNARFTLSTNMDRHIKNHHPDKWKRKSRGGRRTPHATPSNEIYEDAQQTKAENITDVDNITLNPPDKMQHESEQSFEIAPHMMSNHDQHRLQTQEQTADSDQFHSKRPVLLDTGGASVESTSRSPIPQLHDICAGCSQDALHAVSRQNSQIIVLPGRCRSCLRNLSRSACSTPVNSPKHEDTTVDKEHLENRTSLTTSGCLTGTGHESPNSINSLGLKQSHPAQDTSQENQTFNCPFCIVHHRDVEQLQEHLQEKHSEFWSSYRANVQRLHKINSTEEQMSCLFCGDNFATASLLGSHVREMHVINSRPDLRQISEN